MLINVYGGMNKMLPYFIFKDYHLGKFIFIGMVETTGKGPHKEQTQFRIVFAGMLLVDM